MYVCLCKGITDNQIRRAVEEGVGCLPELKSRLGVASCCGRCADCAEQVLGDSLAEREFGPLLQAA